MVKAGDRDGADVVVVQRSVKKKIAKQTHCHCSWLAHLSSLFL